MITFCSPGRIEIGADSISRIGDLVKSLGGTQVLVVMDAFLTTPAIGLERRVIGLLGHAGIKAAAFSAISGEPNSRHVSAGILAAKETGTDCVIALGGGSSIDTAKAGAVLAVNPGLAFVDIAKQMKLNRLPLIAIPTTSGTGSEATRVSVITNESSGLKENPGHPSLVPDIAVLDPQLSVSLPPGLTAFTGMDALTHAIEAYVSSKANSLSDLFAFKAMKIIGQCIEKAVTDGTDLEAREKMALASCLAGVAFSNASTNLAHAGGRALGTYFHVPHGLSVALLLPFVMEFSLEAAEDRYAKVAVALGANAHNSCDVLAKQAIDMVYAYNDKFGVWQEAKSKFIPDVAILRQAIPEMVSNTLSGNGILTNRKVPTEVDVTDMFMKLAAKLRE